MKQAVALLVLAGTAARADDFVIFARGAQLLRVDPDGRHEAELATLDAGKKRVRALRTDAAGTVLLADLDGTWAWMPLDGSAKTLTDLPCSEGAAQLAEDGACVVCRAKQGAVLYNFKLGKAFPLDVPAARVVGADRQRRLVWADAGGVWTAPVGDPKKKTQVAAQPPLRGFSVAPDGTRALGVYADEVYTDAHHKKPAEVLEGFALDGQAVRRKAIQGGVPVDWTHDAQWALVQDGANACIQRALGGEYKCWKGYTVVGASPTGKWVLVLGNRDRGPAKPPPKKRGAKPTPVVREEPEQAASDVPTDDDVAVALPTGPLALYKGDLEGAFTNPPAPLVKIVDGAAVWVSRP